MLTARISTALDVKMKHSTIVKAAAGNLVCAQISSLLIAELVVSARMDSAEKVTSVSNVSARDHLSHKRDFIWIEKEM